MARFSLADLSDQQAGPSTDGVSLAGLGKWQGAPESSNIVDRRGEGPLELWLAPNPLASIMSPQRPYSPDTIEARVATPLSRAAGHDDFPEYNDLFNGRTDQFGRDPMDEFRNALALRATLADLTGGAPAWMRRR